MDLLYWSSIQIQIKEANHAILGVLNGIRGPCKVSQKVYVLKDFKLLLFQQVFKEKKKEEEKSEQSLDLY